MTEHQKRRLKWLESKKTLLRHQQNELAFLRRLRDAEGKMLVGPPEDKMQDGPREFK